mgnify:FL=1
MTNTIKCLLRYYFVKEETKVEYSYNKNCIWIDYSGINELRLYKLPIDHLHIRHWLRFEHCIQPEILTSEHFELYAKAHKRKWIKVI